MNRARIIPILLATALGGSGCSTLGGNVKGDFACRAPSGSCAPMSTIDDRAVASVARDQEAEGTVVSVKQRLDRAGVGGLPGRSSERTLTVIFPAHVDAAGVFHDEARAHVVVEGPAWTIAPAAPASETSQFSRSPAPSSLREAIAGASAPAIEGLEPLPTRAPHLIHGVDAPHEVPPPAGPTPEALAKARAGHRITKPEVAITPAGPRVGPPFGESWSLPRGKVVFPTQGDPATVARKIRDFAGPALDQRGALSGKSAEELRDPFRGVTATEPQP